jgi:DNA repair exonuclease SbcCD ATPase subunit
MSAEEYNQLEPRAAIIANPIYDTVFKKLMENMRIAKFFLSTIMNRQITEVSVLPQEFSYINHMKEDEDKIAYSMYRIDFMATVMTEDGERKKVLIEVQKSWDYKDVMRFRRYLAAQYGKMDEINGKKTVLPITTIYILGFRLHEIEQPCVKIARTYVNMMDGEAFEGKTEFAELLTHDSFIIQAGRITDTRYSTKLEKLLSIFQQSYFIRDDSGVMKEYHCPQGDEDMRLITRVLSEMAANSNERREIENEEEALRVLDVMYGEKFKEQEKTMKEQALTLEEQALALQEKGKALEEQTIALQEQTVVLQEKDKTLQEQDKALQEQAKALEEQAKQIEELKKMIDNRL